MKYISLAMMALAAICKAGADTCADHFGISIFKNKDPYFWDKSQSWNHAKQILGYKLDAWHLFNSGMIVAFTIAIVLWVGLLRIRQQWARWILEVAILGALFNLTFNLFYNQIFRS